jgi:tRNA threonylcarbamoyladenosine biosynthesis protein TsaB
MDKQAFSITLHNDYRESFIGLFFHDRCIESRTLTNKESSKMLLIALEELLKKHTQKLSDLLYIGVHQGPGPFTTLRTILTSANGLAFATQLPLIGVDGLATFINEQKNPDYHYTIALLNAYCNDVYYAIHNNQTDTIEIGCEKIDVIAQKIKTLPPNQIKLIGNGCKLHHETLEKTVGRARPDLNLLPETVSLDAVGAQAWRQWQKKENISTQLLPLYLKQALSMSAPHPTRP